MVERSVVHATFVVERVYDAPPARAFAAWATSEAKSRWFGGPNDKLTLDFKVGGRESSRGAAPNGVIYSYDALYQDIVPNERIIYTYDMHLNEARISVSVATVEFQKKGAGTRLVFTEQGAFLDGLDKPADREHGTGELLNALGAELKRQAAQ